MKHDYICYEWSWNCNVIMVSWIGIWYGFEIGYNCHKICIHGDGIEFRGEKICMVNFITTWYATTRCTVDGSGTCQGPFFYAFLCQGLHGSYGTCDTSLYLFFKEGSHSPCLNSILGGVYLMYWWVWNNLIDWIYFCLDYMLAYGSCQRYKGGGDIREAYCIYAWVKY